jgi:hypothetical protein
MLDRQDLAFRPTTGSSFSAWSTSCRGQREPWETRGSGSGTLRGSYLNFWGDPGGSGELAAWWSGERVGLFGAVSVRGARRDGLALPSSSPRYRALDADNASLETVD